MKGDALGLGLVVEDKFSCKPSTTTKLIINYDEIAQTNKSVGLSIYLSTCCISCWSTVET